MTIEGKGNIFNAFWERGSRTSQKTANFFSFIYLWHAIYKRKSKLQPSGTLRSRYLGENRKKEKTENEINNIENDKD